MQQRITTGFDIRCVCVYTHVRIHIYAYMCMSRAFIQPRITTGFHLRCVCVYTPCATYTRPRLLCAEHRNSSEGYRMLFKKNRTRCTHSDVIMHVLPADALALFLSPARSLANNLRVSVPFCWTGWHRVTRTLYVSRSL
jgi:hypothetical protein